LFAFGWDRFWGQESYETHAGESHPFITIELAEYLVSEGVKKKKNDFSIKTK